jgi:hypothetical protein
MRGGYVLKLFKEIYRRFECADGLVEVIVISNLNPYQLPDTVDAGDEIMDLSLRNASLDLLGHVCHHGMWGRALIIYTSIVVVR